jgi:CheY-like chemotaxis protein
MPKRVLIVDDDRTVTAVLAENLAKLGNGYVFETALSAYEALDKTRKDAFDLIVTDLRMPGMDGLKFMKKIREYYPHTRLILMTGYGNTDIEATAYQLGACRYIDKPFKTEELLAQVRTALAEPELPGRDLLVLSDDQSEAIARCLADLRFEVGAQCILLADVAGQMVANVGESENLELPALVSLVGGSFATAFEMARYLGENQARTLNYHEGEHYDVYSSNVNEELFVVLLFDKRCQRSRIGMVWLYTRRALERLQTTVIGAKRVHASDLVDADFGTMLSDSLDQFFVAGEAEPTAPGAVVGWGALEEDDADGGLILQEVTAPSHETPPAASAPPPTPTTGTSPALAAKQAPVDQQVPAQRAAVETFDLQQALEMGLLDLSWLDQDLA